MLELFSNFFLAAGEFIPHGHCYLWKPELVWLHIISDSLIALAYYSIPITLIYFVCKRVDLPFNGIVLLFSSFIVACGTSHVMEIWTLWHPAYWLSGLLKAITAFVSLYTALALVLLVPKALALPSSAQLEKANSELEREIIERKLVEETLRESEERFRSAFDFAAIGMAIVALDGRWLRVNGSLCEIVGYCEQELLASTFQSITHPDDLESDLNYTGQLLRGEIRSYQLEKRYFHKLGHVVWILLSASLVRDTQGQPLYFITQIQDITERKQVEAALQESEARLRLALEAAHMGTWEWNILTNEVIYSDQLGPVVGLPRDTYHLTYEAFLDSVHPEDREYVAQALARAIAEGVNYALEFRVIWPDGTLHWVGNNGRVYRDETGKPLRMLGVVWDITDRKLAEEQLRWEEVLLRSMTSASPLAFYVVDNYTDAILYFNHRFCEIWGIEHLKEQMQRGVLNNKDIIPHFLPLLIDVTAFAESCKFLHNEENRAVVEDEIPFVDGRTIRRFSSQVCDEEDRYFGRLYIYEDVTERKQAEERLQLLERAIAASHNGIIISDAQVPDNPVIYVNSGFERITGYTASEVIGKNFRLLQGTDTKQPALEQLRCAIASGTETQVVLRNYRKDGTLFWNEFCLTPLTDETGHLTHFIGVQIDVTERKQAEEALRQQFLREQLVGAITQRIRQSLNLQEILNATVTQVRQVLQAERVLVYRFQPGGMRSVVTEAVVPGLGALLGETFSEEVLPQESQRLYKGREIRAISNIEQADLSPATVEFLQQLGVKAKVLVPIFQGEHLWGLLVAHQCSEPRQWQQFEINLLEQLATQVAIAIQQSQLYEQAQSHAQQLEQTLQKLQRTQAQLVQSEKMSSLGQLVAGVAHEINNPTGFIYANIQPAMEYAQNLIHLIQLYQGHYPKPVKEITEQLELIEPDFIATDFPKLLMSMQEGAERINQIVLSLRNFSRLDEMGFKRVDIHEGIDNTLLILQHRLKQQCHRPEIQVIKNYGSLPKVECSPGQLNQVFMNILSNAIDALDELKVDQLKVESLEENFQSSNLQHSPPCIWIHTEVTKRDWVTIRIADNGSGIKAEVQSKIFDPFFTTKPVGSGTGLGLSISYQIVVDKHGGKLRFHSVGQGTEFSIKLPIVQGKMPLALESRQTSLFS